MIGRLSGAALLAMLASLLLPGCAPLSQPAGATSAGAAAAAVESRSITLPAGDGQASALLLVPAGSGPRPGVIVWPDIAGLRPAYAAIGRDLAAAGYVVLIPNNFYRSAQLDGTTGSASLSADDMRTRLADWRAAASDEGIARDARAYVAYLDGTGLVDRSRPIGVVGYNVGAAHAFRAAAAVPDRIGAVAVAHPLGVATERPNSPHLLVGGTHASWLVVMAAPDDEREPGDKDDLRRAFADAGQAGTVRVVDAAHGFAVPDNANFDATAAAGFQQDMLALFARALR